MDLRAENTASESPKKLEFTKEELDAFKEVKRKLVELKLPGGEAITDREIVALPLFPSQSTKYRALQRLSRSTQSVRH